MEMFYVVGGLWLLGWVLHALTERRPPLDDRGVLKAYCTLEHYKKTGRVRTYFCEGSYEQD